MVVAIIRVFQSPRRRALYKDILLHLNVIQDFPPCIYFYSTSLFISCFVLMLFLTVNMYSICIFFYPPISVQYYQEFSCSAAVSGNGCNVEYALHVLHLLKGNIKVTDQGQY